MATTYQEYTGNASTTTFSYPFPVLKTEDIKVALNGVTQTTGYTATTSPAQVVFSSAPASGVIVRVYRDTDVDAAKGVFAAGSSIRAADLNNNQDQVLYALQEEQNQKGIYESISLDDSRSIKFGNSDDASIYWDNTGNEMGHQMMITSAGPMKLSTGNSKNFQFYEGTDIALTIGTSINAYVNVVPDTDNTRDLGSSSKEWKDLYVDGTGYIDTISADTATINGNLVVTGTISDSGGNLELSDDVNISGHLRFPDDKKIYLGNGDDAYIDWDTDGWFDRVNIRSNGDIWSYVPSGKSHLFVVNDAGVLGVNETYIEAKKDLKPGTNSSFDLGKSDKQWKDLYVDGTGYIDTVNADDITGSAIVTTGTSTSDTKVYSAKRCDELYYNLASDEEIQSGETWVATDNKLATTAAIDARIVDLVDDVGGFVPIANETSFPNTNPDVNNGAGTLISVPLANTLTSDGNGNISINNGTLGNSTVVITNAGDTKTYAQGFGIIVETTTTLNTYTFHRYVPKATEVTTVAGSITNVNAVAGNASNINAVAGNASNINSAVSNASNINSAVSNASNINSAVSNASNINSAVSNASNINTVAGIASNVTTVAGISSDVTAVAGDAADIGACSTNIGSIAAIGSDLANNFENITDYGAITGAVTSTSGTSDITTVANSITNVNAVGTIAANVTTVAGISANVTSVAGNATNINTCATNISAITGASTQATNAATSATNAASSATTASTQATNASTSATSASSSATTATSQASTATTQASNASTSAANALAYRNTAQEHRDSASAILTQVESAPYNLSDSASTHTAWGNITDTGANAVFTNESSNILLTMAEGSSSYNYGSIT